MNRRMRTLAGSLGLAAMALSLGESVLASVCAPPMDMSSMDMSSMGAAAPEMSEGMDGMPGMLMHGDEQGQDLGQDQDSRFDECPLGPALGQGCLALASLPGVPPRSGDAADNDSGQWAADSMRPDLLLSHALFRPPRA